MKILHLTFSVDCNDEIIHKYEKEGHQVSYLYFNDGTRGKYSIGSERARRYYQKHREYLETFDMIVISETTPLCRVFLENAPETTRMTIWVNNSFDYCDESNDDCNFPDPDYYELMRKAVQEMKNVTFTFWTEIAREKMQAKLKIPCPGEIVKPSGYLVTYPLQEPVEQDCYFVGEFHNDNIMLNLADELRGFGIKVHSGRIHDPRDLRRYGAGLVHIPNSWSSLLLYRCFYMNVPVSIPSKKFLLELRDTYANFHWESHFSAENIEKSDWYAPENSKRIRYFDSFESLTKTI